MQAQTRFLSNDVTFVSTASQRLPANAAPNCQARFLAAAYARIATIAGLHVVNFELSAVAS
jgi:hypothetical protein